MAVVTKESLVRLAKTVAAAALGALAASLPGLGLPPAVALVASALVAAGLLHVKKP